MSRSLHLALLHSLTNPLPLEPSCQTSSPSSCHFRPRRRKPCHRPSGLVRAVDQIGGSDAKNLSERMFNFPMNSQIHFYTPRLPCTFFAFAIYLEFCFAIDFLSPVLRFTTWREGLFLLYMLQMKVLAYESICIEPIF